VIAARGWRHSAGRVAPRGRSQTAKRSGAGCEVKQATPTWGGCEPAAPLPGFPANTNVEGEEPEPSYPQAQLKQLEGEGRALRLRDGTYGWGCDRRDLMNCIAAFQRGEAPKSEAPAVKAFIKMRARILGFESLLPASRQSKARPQYAEGERPAPDSAPSVGGQQQ
jgi:hypothetical protein